MDVATLALLISLLSLTLSFINLVRDRHVVRVRATPFWKTKNTLTPDGVEVTVSNHGKRPISISRIYAQQHGLPVVGRSFPVLSNEDVRIEVGQSASTRIVAGDPLFCWSNVGEFRLCRFVVEDALGKRYKVPPGGVLNRPGNRGGSNS